MANILSFTLKVSGFRYDNISELYPHLSSKFYAKSAMKPTAREILKRGMIVYFAPSRQGQVQLNPRVVFLL